MGDAKRSDRCSNTLLRVDEVVGLGRDIARSYRANAVNCSVFGPRIGKLNAVAFHAERITQPAPGPPSQPRSRGNARYLVSSLGAGPHFVRVERMDTHPACPPDGPACTFCIPGGRACARQHVEVDDPETITQREQVVADEESVERASGQLASVRAAAGRTALRLGDVGIIFQSASDPPLSGAFRRIAADACDGVDHV